MIYLVCHSGFLNYGDELIAGAWIAFLAKRYPQKQIYVDTCCPGVASLLHGSFSNVVYTDTLWKLARLCLGKDMDYILDLKFIQNASSDIELGLDHFKRAEIVHFVGGGYITEYHYPNYAILLLATRFKAKCKFSLIATGLGIEPLSRGHRTILQRIFEHFDNVDLRDQESYNTMQEGTHKPKLTLSPDDAFLSEYVFASSPEVDGKLIIIAQRDEVSDVVLPFLLDLIKMCPLSNNGVTILVLDKGADLALARQVLNLSDVPIEIVDHVDLCRYGLPITPKDFVFTTRFHGHLVASALGARGICASVRLPYYDIKHRSLIDLGSGFDLIGMHDFPFGSYDWKKRNRTFFDNREDITARKMRVVETLYN